MGYTWVRTCSAGIETVYPRLIYAIVGSWDGDVITLRRDADGASAVVREIEDDRWTCAGRMSDGTPTPLWARLEAFAAFADMHTPDVCHEHDALTVAEDY
jgi:hypothetical protein